MARFQVQNKAYINQDDDKYGGALQSIEDAVNRISDQANVDPSSAQVATPTPVSKISVIEKDGIHDIAIHDNSPAYNGIQYSAYYSRTPDMANAHRIDLGESQNHRANLGGGKYYWAASSKYSASGHSPMVYHPDPVGSGAHAGPPMQKAMGFTTQFRNSNTPPIRR